jgi:uncharacterized protein (TIGR02300 family)
VAKPELGKKHECAECSARFYDLKKNPAICPKCGTKVAPPTKPKAASRAPVAVAKAPDKKPKKKVDPKDPKDADAEASEDSDAKAEGLFPTEGDKK